MPTPQNLETAFAGESQANRKYLAFAAKASAEGKPETAKLFRAVAQAETIHAFSHYRALGAVKSTSDNLQVAINGEDYEVTQMYPPFLAEAEKENNRAAIMTFKHALESEKVHRGMFQNALAVLKENKDLRPARYWVCDVCGHTHEGDSAPEKCPICGALKKVYTEVK